MNIKHLIILAILLFIIINFLGDTYKKKEKNNKKIDIINNDLKEDSNDLYINPYLSNEMQPNIIKKYNDSKIKVFPNIINSNKNTNDNYDNLNKHQLMNFLNFLVRI